ncbi:Uncharacterised protein [Mycobacteroides abscessus subsp. abscessus]|nr:Uncharacterised protein [Mycobacteroides abscessus subsp. abscessus]
MRQSRLSHILYRGLKCFSLSYPGGSSRFARSTIASPMRCGTRRAR